MLLCESCLAIVDHVMTDLKKKVGILVSGRRLAAVWPPSRVPVIRRPTCVLFQGKVKNQEVAITGLLDDVCDQSNMKRFKFIPPKMVCSCGLSPTRAARN